MSTLIDRIKIWATGGTKTTPSDVKIELGWVGGEQPPHEWENERMNKRDGLMVDVIDSVNDSPAGGRSLFKNRNVATCIPESMGLPFSADNFYDSGDALINDACLYNHEGVKLLVFVHTPSTGTAYIKTYNILDGTVVNHAFPGDVVVGLCSTGQYIYILYANIVGANHEYFITAVDGDTWAALPGWAGTDPQLGTEATADIDGRPFCAVTPAGNILCGGRWYGVSGDDKLAVVDADTGTITTSGNAGLASAVFPSGDCVAVGSVMYFTALENASTDMWLSAADETDLSIKGVASASIPNNHGAPATVGEQMALATLGDHFMVGYKDGAANISIELKSEDYATLFSGSHVLETNAKLGPMVFDGIHVWILFKAAGSALTSTVVYKFNPQSFSTQMTPNIDFTLDAGSQHVLDNYDTNDTLVYMRPPIVFDGAGVWVSPYAPTGGNFSGQWFRVSNVHNR